MGRHLSAPWDELQVERDTYKERSFCMVFHGKDGDYTSEWYTLHKGEDAVTAARAVCQKFGWDKRSPAARKNK